MQLVTFLAAGILGLSSCANLSKNLLKDPEVTVTDVGVKTVTSRDVTVNLRLNIFNPNALSLDLGKVSYGFNLAGHNVTEGVSEQNIPIKANGDTPVSIPLTFKYDTMSDIVAGFFNKTLTKEYVLKGSVNVGIFNLPFNKKGELQIGR